MCVVFPSNGLFKRELCVNQSRRGSEDESRDPSEDGLQIDVVTNNEPDPHHSPRVIFICGGPGSDKSTKVSRVASDFPGWRPISCGQLLWSLVAQHEANDELAKEVGFLMRNGDMVPSEVTVDLLSKAMKTTPAEERLEGFLVSGFPRDVSQCRLFEERVSTILHLIR